MNTSMGLEKWRSVANVPEVFLRHNEGLENYTYAVLAGV